MSSSHAADQAFSSWSSMPQQERSEILLRLADAVQQHQPIIAQLEALDAGKIQAQAAGDVQNFVDTLRYFVGLADQVELRTKLDVPGHDAWTVKQPWGACAFIFPWNFPFLLIGWGISPALAAGNTVVIKPAEQAAVVAAKLVEMLRDVGFRKGYSTSFPVSARKSDHTSSNMAMSTLWRSLDRRKSARRSFGRAPLRAPARRLSRR